jgi:signal transduction histidine kinase
VDIHAVVREAVELARSERGGREIILGPSIEGKIPPVLANRESLAKVVYEVIVNAIEATPEGGAVTVDALEHPRWIAVRVTDSGPGIRRQVLRKVFDPFFSTKEKARGLGLTTGLELMRQMRGTIRIERTGPSGTVVSVRAPAAVPKG